jgi:uracil-DNA glycosylase
MKRMSNKKAELDRLYKKMQHCKSCPLGRLRLNSFGSRLEGGGEQADIFFVGMNPSNRRIALHKKGTWLIFQELPSNISKDVGKLGLVYSQELGGWVARNDAPLLLALQFLGIKRDRVYITNLVKCCTKDNRLIYRRDKNIIEKCKNLFLLKEISILKPRIVIGLGAIFLKSFSLKHFGEISKLSIQNWETSITAIHHPGYYLRKGILGKNKKLIAAYAG